MKGSFRGRNFQSEINIANQPPDIPSKERLLELFLRKISEINFSDVLYNQRWFKHNHRRN
jgi:hypothetical protein